MFEQLSLLLSNSSYLSLIYFLATVLKGKATYFSFPSATYQEQPPPSLLQPQSFLPPFFLQLHPKNSYQSPPSLPSSATCFLPLSSSHIPRTATSLPSSATHFSHSFLSFSHTPGTPGNFLQKSQSLQPYPREVFSNPPFLCSRDAPQTPDRRRW